MTPTLRWLLLAVLWLFAPGPAAAHDMPGEMRVHAFVRVEGERLRVLVRVPLALTLNLDLPKHGNGYLDLAQAEQRLPDAIQAIAKDMRFFEDGQALLLADGQARISLPSDKSFQRYEAALATTSTRLPPGTDVFWNQGYLDARLDYRIAAASGSFAVDFAISPALADRLKFDLRLVGADGTVRAFEFPTGSGLIALDPRWHQAAWSFVKSGFAHILGGPDHLLFLLCLIVPFRRLSWYLVGVVSAFTVAHATTLIAAAYGWVPSGEWFPPLVETLIALSILYMAAENVLRPNLERRWMITALFGLVHGFGFSFALSNEMQFAGEHLLLSLLAFNVGIELGQLLALSIAWPLLAWAMSRPALNPKVIVALISASVGHTAWHWAGERYDALMAVPWPAADMAGLARAASLALVLLAIWLLRRAWQRRGGPARRPQQP